MSVEIRTCPPDRFAELLKTAEIAFSEDVSDELIERVRKVSDPARFVCALDDDRFVATGGVFTVNLSVPGGDLPAGGVTWVTVVPSHRRRGILRGMMRLMVDDCHARNEPLAMLWASEGAIYQRFGYGMATCDVSIEAETATARFAREWPAEGSCRLLRAGEGLDLVTPVYEAARAQRAGFLARTPDWWVGQLPLVDKDAKGGEARRLVVFEADKGPEAYAVYKTKMAWGPQGGSGTVIVDEAIASTERGTREIWRYLFNIDLMRTVKAGRLPVDHPILLLAAEPRRLRMSLGDGLWLRIVDVKAALEGRTYGIDGRAGGQVVFDLSDEYCPWNAGRWALEVSEGRARVAPTKAEADLALDANDLGSLFLGGFSAASLARSGRVVELRSGGLIAADALFRTALQPWCPQEF
jgi:predicted acetyltransferase